MIYRFCFCVFPLFIMLYLYMFASYLSRALVCENMIFN